MPAEPFVVEDAARVLEHPDTPAAYIDWAEILPLTGHEDRIHLGNLLGWSYPAARTPLGASRDIFERALAGVHEDLLDEWMAALGTTPVEDFLDHHVPFLRNFAGMAGANPNALVRGYLGAYRDPTATPSRPVDRRLGRAYPESVLIEVTKSCNFACSMCSSRTGGFLAERTMPLPVFGDVVRILGPNASTLRINGYGESTLVPNLAHYLDCLDEFKFRGIREIITNLSAPDGVYEDLFSRGFVILASWDAAERALFESIRVGADYPEMLRRLHALGRTARVQPERLGLLSTIQESNLAEIVPLVRLASEAGAGLVIFNMVKEADGSPWMERRFDEIRLRFAEAGELAAGRGVVVRIPDHIGKARLILPQARRSSASFCDRPWRELLIRWDCELSVCNMFNPYSYGMLRRPGPERDAADRFRRLWDGPNARLFREIINSDAPHPYCRDCYFLYA